MNHSTAPKLFYAILFIFLGLFCWLCWTFLSAIILGLVITSALYPLYSWYKKLFKGNEVFKAVTMTVFIFLILTIPISGFIGSLYNETLEFYGRTKNSVSLQKIQEILENDSVWVTRLKKISELGSIELDPQSIQKFIAEKMKDFVFYLTTQLSLIATNLMSFLLNFLLMMLIIFYIFKDGPRLNNYLLSVLPFPKAQQELILAKFNEMGRAIIFGNGLSGIIQGILGGFAFYFFGLGSPFLWGTIMGFLAFLPVIGASVVFIPATIILLIQGHVGAGIAFLIYNATYSILIEYFIKPKLIGKGMKMNTIFVFIGILGGLQLWGILGIIYGPFIITIIFTLFEIYRLEYRPTNI
ncbi:MAG: AI-2E family transporter [Deltaproteobacteria bacterium]|nr:AI-2E family transporter [Deltaproteobacteria bacterium]